MRTIKFRAWEKSKMIYIGSPRNDTSLIISEECWNVIDHFTGKPIEIANDENSMLMQFTGLVDKNGKEIYEGDIIKVENGENPAICKCEFELGQFVLRDNADGSWTRQFYHQSERLLIIGNVYENPELL